MKNQIGILWAGTFLKIRFGMLLHKTCIAIRNLVQERFLLSKQLLWLKKGFLIYPILHEIHFEKTPVFCGPDPVNNNMAVSLQNLGKGTVQNRLILQELMQVVFDIGILILGTLI